MAETRITSKYQVTIPKKIRKMYQIKEGDELIFMPHGEKILVEKKEQAMLVRELPLKIKTPKVKDVHEWRDIARRQAMKESSR